MTSIKWAYFQYAACELKLPVRASPSMNKSRRLNEKIKDKPFTQSLAHLSQGFFFSLFPPFFPDYPTSQCECSTQAALPEFSTLMLEFGGEPRRKECNSPSWKPARGLATATPLFTLGRSSLETFYEIPEAARSSVLWQSRLVCKYSLWMRMFGLHDKNKADVSSFGTGDNKINTRYSVPQDCKAFWVTSDPQHTSCTVRGLCFQVAPPPIPRKAPVCVWGR